MKAYSKMILNSIFDINLDTRGINIFQRLHSHFIDGFKKENVNFLSSAEPRAAPLCESPHQGLVPT